MNKVVIFTIGLTIGGVAGYFYGKKKFKSDFDRSDNNVAGEAPDDYYESEEVNTKAAEEAEANRDKPDIMQYAKALASIRKNSGDKYFEDTRNYSYISPDDFGDDGEYDTETWYYMSDVILVDSQHKLVDNFVEKVGNFTTHFEDDQVCIKNDKLKMYIEILRDNESYEEWIQEHPSMPIIDDGDDEDAEE